MKSVLFVSHSSADNALVEQLTKLIDARTEAQCKTIADIHDLRQGMAWSPQLYQWMARCQAALLLLTENALRSNWVLQEATILRARKVLDPTFPLLIVIPDALRARIDVEPDLKTRWQLFEPLELRAIQGLPSLDAAPIYNAVMVEVAKATPAKSYLERLSGLLTDILSAYKDKKDTLDYLSTKMELQDAEWTRIYGGSESVVEMIARRLQGSLGGFEGVRDLLQSVKSVSDRDTLRNLLGATASYWIDLGAASAFAAVAERRPPRLIAVRSSVLQEYSGELYLARYYRPHRLEPIIITVSGGNEAAGIDDLQQQFVEAVRRANAAYRKMSDEKLITLLQDPKEQKKLTFVFLPEQRFEDVALGLAERFPAFVFVVPVTVGDRARVGWTHCTWVQPDVDEGDETRRYADYGEALGLIG